MFQFPGLSPAPYEFGCGRRGMTPAGFPRSDTPGSKAVCASPGLFAACRVLRRLPMPRHPPCAFGILAISVDHLLRLGGEGVPPPRRAYFVCDRSYSIVMRTAFSLHSLTLRNRVVGSHSFMPRHVAVPRVCSCQGAGPHGPCEGRALGAGCWDGGLIRCLPRKEVIQPHLPVRLPCYDFTPLTPRTFDASAPRGGSAGGFGCRRLGWCDGRCVQGPGTYSPRRADPRLLATPTSRRRVAACDPNWGRLCGIRSPSRGGSPLYRPL